MSFMRCRCLYQGLSVLAHCALPKETRQKYRNVTPREESIKTLCLFLFTPLLGASGFVAPDFDSDL